MYTYTQEHLLRKLALELAVGTDRLLSTDMLTKRAEAFYEFLAGSNDTK